MKEPETLEELHERFEEAQAAVLSLQGKLQIYREENLFFADGDWFELKRQAAYLQFHPRSGAMRGSLNLLVSKATYRPGHSYVVPTSEMLRFLNAAAVELRYWGRFVALALTMGSAIAAGASAWLLTFLSLNPWIIALILLCMIITAGLIYSAAKKSAKDDKKKPGPDPDPKPKPEPIPFVPIVPNMTRAPCYGSHQVAWEAKKKEAKSVARSQLSRIRRGKLAKGKVAHNVVAAGFVFWSDGSSTGVLWRKNAPPRGHRPDAPVTELHIQTLLAKNGDAPNHASDAEVHLMRELEPNLTRTQVGCVYVCVAGKEICSWCRQLLVTKIPNHAAYQKFYEFVPPVELP